MTNCCLGVIFLSYFYGRGNFIEFYIDLLIEMCSTMEYFAILITTASLYMGLCFYTNGMVDDLNMHMNKAAGGRSRTNTRNRLNYIDDALAYINSIQFHYKIIG